MSAATFIERRKRPNGESADGTPDYTSTDESSPEPNDSGQEGDRG